ETVETIEARPAWNALRLRLTQDYLLVTGRTYAYLQGADLNLRPGDGLLFVGDEYIDEGDKNRWQFRIINSVTINVDEKWTRVIWEKALEDNTPKSNPQVHVFRRRVAPFGHNAPMWVTMPLSFKQTYPNSSNGTAEEWPFFNLSDSENEVYLDSVYPDIVPHT